MLFYPEDPLLKWCFLLLEGVERLEILCCYPTSVLNYCSSLEFHLPDVPLVSPSFTYSDANPDGPNLTNYILIVVEEKGHYSFHLQVFICSIVADTRGQVSVTKKKNEKNNRVYNEPS